MRNVTTLNIICIRGLFLHFTTLHVQLTPKVEAQLIATIRLKGTKAAAVMRAILGWEDGLKKKKKKKKETAINEGSFPHDVWRGYAKAVCTCIRNGSNCPLLSIADTSPIRRQRAQTIQGLATLGPITHFDPLCIASVSHPGPLLRPKMDKAREKAVS